MKYKALVLVEGVHKGLIVDHEFMKKFIESAELPKNLGIEFYDTSVLNGKLGQLTSLELVDNRVYGVFDIPDWLSSIEETPHFAISVSRDRHTLSQACIVQKSYFEE